MGLSCENSCIDKLTNIWVIPDIFRISVICVGLAPKSGGSLSLSLFYFLVELVSRCSALERRCSSQMVNFRPPVLCFAVWCCACCKKPRFMTPWKVHNSALRAWRAWHSYTTSRSTDDEGNLPNGMRWLCARHYVDMIYDWLGFKTILGRSLRWVNIFSTVSVPSGLEVQA